MASPTSEIAVGSAIIASLGLALAAYKVFGRPKPPKADIDDVNGGRHSLFIIENLDAVSHLLSPVKSLPIAFYSDYWGVGESALLGNDNIFRPRGRPALYFFKQYEYMVKRIDFFRAYCKKLVEEGADPYGLPGVLIMGTHGIGKTSFLDYYLARELSLGKPVIYVKDDACYIYKDRSVYVSREVPYFGKEFLHILCLVDADAKKPAPTYLLHNSYPFLLMASSPRRDRYQDWIKQRASGRSPTFVFNIPTPDELVKALKVNHEYSELADEKIRDAIQLFGHNMRTLIVVLSEGPEIVANNIWMTAKQLDTSKLKSIITNNVNDVGDASHSIVTTVCLDQPQPEAGIRYRSRDTPEQAIAGHIAMEALLGSHGKAVYVDHIHLLETFSKIPGARTSAGWVWEHWAHAQICKGGNFTLEPITFQQPTRASERSNPTDQQTPISDTTQPIQISIPPLNIHPFDAKDQTSTTCGDEYFIPTNKNNATFDAFFHHQSDSIGQSCGIGLQMTLSDTHSLNAKGLKALHDRLQARTCTRHMYVVVIRKGRGFKNFKPTPSSSQHQQFRFFTMELDLPVGGEPACFDGDENKGEGEGDKILVEES